HERKGREEKRRGAVALAKAELTRARCFAILRGHMAEASTPVPTSFPKSEIKVLLLENIHPSAHEIFGGEGYQVESVPRALKEEELVERLSDGIHLLGIRSKTRVTARALEAGKRLLSVGAFCIGTNQIDLGAAKRCGIPVFNA